MSEGATMATNDETRLAEMQTLDALLDLARMARTVLASLHGRTVLQSLGGPRVLQTELNLAWVLTPFSAALDAYDAAAANRAHDSQALTQEVTE